MEENNKGFTRRKVVQSAGVGLFSSALSLPVSARGRRSHSDNFDKDFSQARKIREKNGSQEKFVQFLVNKGYKVARNDEVLRIPQQSSNGEISTQEIQKQEVATSMTLTEGCDGDHMYVDYHFAINADETFGPAGDAGPDEITITWNDDHFRTVDYRWYISADNGHIKSTELNGLNWEWKDGKSCTQHCDVRWSCGGKIEKLQTNQERAVRGKYHHTWTGVEYSGFGVSSTGSVVWSVSPTENSWEGKYETREESDAVNNPDRCNGP